MTTVNLNRINPESTLSIASGQLSLLDITDSSSSVTGSLITAGGMGVAKKLYIGTDLGVGGNIISGTWNGSIITATYGGTGASTLTSNAVLLGNGTGVVQSPSTITYAASTLTLPKLVSNDATDSASNSTGAVILSGGLGIAKDVYIGGGTLGLDNGVSNLILYNANGVGTPAFTTRSIGTKIVVSPNLSGATTDYGIGVELNNLWFDSSATTSGFKWYHGTLNTLELSDTQLYVKQTTAAASTATGALRVAGGAGIAGALYADSMSITNAISSGTWNGSVITATYGGTGAATLTSNAVLLGNGTGVIQSPSTITFTASTLTLPKLTSNDATASTSNSTGSILSSGGLGISNATEAISSTNGGSITTAGGLAVAKKLFVGADVSVGGNITSGTWNGSIITVTYGGTGAATLTSNAVLLGNGTGTIQSPSTMTYTTSTLTLPKLVSNDATDSSSSITGAIITAGGLGVAKKLFVGGGEINLTNGTSNTIVHGAGGGAPTQTTRSVGTKIVLNSGVTASTLDYAIGIESQHMWFSAPSGVGGDGFKWYTGNSVTNIMRLGSSQLNLAITTESSSSITGSIITAGGIGIAKKLYVGGVGHFTSTVDMNNTKIINLASPTATSDAVNKSYVDGLVQGLSTKNSVKVATVSPGTLISSFENGDTIDSFVVATGDRILIKNQATGAENGIYIINVSGAPTRADDLAATSNAAGVYVFVESGTVNGDNGFVCTNDTGSGVVGTNALVFTQFSGAGQIDAGTGLTKIGNQINVDASQTQVTAVGTLITGTWNANTITVPYGGTGVATLTSNAILLGNGTGTIQSPSTITYATSTLTLPKIISNDPTASTSSIAGAVLLSGGLSISNSTEATSSTNGGTITTAGGAAIAKKLFVGGELAVAGATNLTDAVTLTSTGGTPIISTVVTDGTRAAYNNYINSNTNSVCYSGLDGIGFIALNTGGYIIATAAANSNKNVCIAPGGSATMLTVSTTGLSVSGTTDASSAAAGGSFTTAGGMGIAKKLFVGSVLEVDTTSNLVKINSVNVSPSSGDISEKSFSAANNVLAASSVTGFAFANGTVRSFKALCSVVIDATADLFAIFEITAIQKGASWEMTTVYTGDDTNIIFTITSGGQIQYTSGNEVGFVSSTFKFRARTTSV